jgi:hypothetical protein
VLGARALVCDSGSAVLSHAGEAAVADVLPASRRSGGAVVFPRHGGVDYGGGAWVGPSPLSFLSLGLGFG